MATLYTGQLGMGTEMARRIVDYNWSATELGAIDGWSRTLRTALDLCLGSRMCSCIYWGPQRLILYNDAYSSILGTKHPWALGRTASEVWPEIFDVIGPLLECTYKSGETTGGDDMPLYLNRAGYVEEFYCSFTYTPLIDHLGAIEGIFATLPETSVRVIGERRLRTLQKLGADSREARHAQEALQFAAEVMAENPYDIPFAVLYSWRDDESVACLSATVNMKAGTSLSPQQVDLEGEAEIAVAVRTALSEGHAVLTVRPAHHPIPLGAWQVPAGEIIVLPLRPYSADAPTAVMLAGVSPLKRLDDDYRAFFRMLADQITRLLVKAFTHEQEAVRVRELQERARVAQQAERVRIARDLHDTLLQSMQGMHFLIEAGLDRARACDSAAQELFTSALQASQQAIQEGREVLSLLRSTAPVTDSVVTALRDLGSECVAGTAIRVEVDVAGAPCGLAADVWNETYGLCREALSNAVRHADARLLRILVSYTDPFEVTVEDDGRGVDASVARYGRAGHFGMQGMRERAASIGGNVEVVRGRHRGTIVALKVPAARAYRQDRGA